MAQEDTGNVNQTLPHLRNVAQAKCRKYIGYMPKSIRYSPTRYMKCKIGICHTLGMRPTTGYKDDNPNTSL